LAHAKGVLASPEKYFLGRIKLKSSGLSFQQAING
jgi:hypothetical protein